MKTSTKTIIKCIIAIIMVMCTLCIPAQAYSSSVTIYVDGTPVSGVDAWLDSSGTVWVSDYYKAVPKVFPREAGDLHFPDMVEDRPLQDMADSFGYSLKVSGQSAYLTKKGSNWSASTPAASSGGNGTIGTNSGIINNYGSTNGNTSDNSYRNSYRTYNFNSKNGTISPSNPTTSNYTPSNRTNTSNYTPSNQNDSYTPSNQNSSYSQSNASNDYYTPSNTASNQNDRYTPNNQNNGYSSTPSTSTSKNKNTNIGGNVTINNITNNVTTNNVTNNNVTNNTTINYNGGNGNVGDTKIQIDNSSNSVITSSGNGAMAAKPEDKTELEPDEDEEKEEEGEETTAVTMKVYVNGLKVDTDAVTLDSSGEIMVTEQGVKQIFPEANSAGKTHATLQEWANELGYTLIRNGLRVYLSNEPGYAPVEVSCNGKVVDFPDQQPFVINGRTMTPVRAIVEMFGCTVEWKNGAVVIRKDDTTITLYIGSTTYTINGQEFALDVPAQTMNDRTVVPLRFIAEGMGYDVTYNGDNAVKMVNITEKE